MVTLADYTPRQLLAANVRRLMEATPDMRTAERLAPRCLWPSGHKKAGKKIAPRTIRYVLDARQDSPSPSVDLICAIAFALGRQPWELLADDEQTKKYLLGVLMSSSRAADSSVERAFGKVQA